MVEAQGPSVSERHPVKGVRRRPGLAIELQDLVALGGRPKHRIARAPADVGRERDRHAGPDEPCHIEQSRSQEQIRRRTKGCDGAARRHRSDFRGPHMDAVAEH